jgi:predicted ester cyclase
MMRGGFPDIQWKVEDNVAEDDKVAVLFSMRGTHRGPFFGVPPTGKPILGQSMAIYRLAGGQIAEENGLPDMLGILQHKLVHYRHPKTRREHKSYESSVV